VAYITRLIKHNNIKTLESSHENIRIEHKLGKKKGKLQIIVISMWDPPTSLTQKNNKQLAKLVKPKDNINVLLYKKLLS
jgi:hypothetical protein